VLKLRTTKGVAGAAPFLFAYPSTAMPLEPLRDKTAYTSDEWGTDPVPGRRQVSAVFLAHAPVPHQVAALALYLVLYRVLYLALLSESRALRPAERFVYNF